MSSAMLLEQTAIHLTRQTGRWDRRRRWVSCLLWGPRVLIAGLVFGIVIALISRMRPWLLPEQIALVTGGVTALILAGTLVVIWMWPRSPAHRARYFDHLFDLKERVSTAIELSAGLIPLPLTLAERQLTDAVDATRHVNVSARLPARVRGWELLLLVVLAALFVFLLVADNPQTDEIMARRDLQEAIDEQAAALEEAIDDIENDPTLTEAEQDALTDPLAEALAILQQQDISQQEAVAALAEAAQALRDMSDGMLSEQAAAYQNAASELAGSDLTSDVAQALKRPDLDATAQALDDLANELGKQDLSQQEQDDLAERLEQAADELEQANPALAQKLREAAQALREGDLEAAQQALREAADLLREQQEQLRESPLAEAAQTAMQQAEQSQQELAQAGQEQAESQMVQSQQQGQQQTGQQAQQSGNQQTQQGQPSGQQAGEPQAGEGETAQQQSQSGEGQPQSGQGETGAEGQQPSEGGQGQPQTQGEGQQSQAQSSGDGQGQDPTTGDTQQTGTGQTGASGEQSAGQNQSGQEGSAEGGANSPSAGAGEGGAGSDTTTGQVSQGGEISSNDAAPGGFEEYNPEYAPSTIGGESEDVVDVGGEGTTPEGAPIQEGDFGPNPTGQSTLSYTGVYNRYRGIVSDALESGRIPLDQRDVIHDYFSSLER